MKRRWLVTTRKCYSFDFFSFLPLDALHTSTVYAMTILPVSYVCTVSKWLNVSPSNLRDSDGYGLWFACDTSSSSLFSSVSRADDEAARNASTSVCLVSLPSLNQCLHFSSPDLLSRCQSTFSFVFHLRHMALLCCLFVCLFDWLTDWLTDWTRALNKVIIENSQFSTCNLLYLGNDTRYNIHKYKNTRGELKWHFCSQLPSSFFFIFSPITAASIWTERRLPCVF